MVFFRFFPSSSIGENCKHTRSGKISLFPSLRNATSFEKGSNANKDDSPACWECDCFTTFFDKSLMDHTLEKEIDIQALLQDLSTNIQESSSNSLSSTRTPSWLLSSGSTHTVLVKTRNSITTFPHTSLQFTTCSLTLSAIRARFHQCREDVYRRTSV